MERSVSVDNLNIKKEGNIELENLKITNKLLLERINELENDGNVRQTDDHHYEEVNFENDLNKSYEELSTRFSSAASQRLEALKILKTLIPHDLNDQLVDQFVIQAFRSIKRYFPKLVDRDIIELVTHRLPKKLANSYGALRSCTTQKEFTKELCCLVYESGRSDHTAITNFLKFEPKNVQKLGFRELVLDIVKNAQSLMLFDAITDDTKTQLMLDKLFTYIPFSVISEIKQKIDVNSLPSSSFVEALKPFFHNPLLDREVRLFLKTYKNNQDSNKEVKELKTNEIEKPKETQTKKDKGRTPRAVCYRCGSGFHSSSECYVYKDHVSDHCVHCLKREKVKLYHKSNLCKLNK